MPARAPTPTTLTPGYQTGGISFLKAEAKLPQAQEHDAGRMNDDPPFLRASVPPATVAAIKSEWQRMSCWDHYHCPSSVLEKTHHDEMRTAMQAVLKEAMDKPSGAVVKGKGRGKAKVPTKKYTDCLVYAIHVLDTTTSAKAKELKHRDNACSKVTASKYCTCHWSASPEVMCGVCRKSGTRFAQPHSVRLPKDANGTVGVRFTGEWVLMLAEIKHGYPAADVHALEHFLEHRVSHINGRSVAGKDATTQAVAASKGDVEITFFPRYMSIVECKAQHLRQLQSGRTEPIPVGPTEDEVRQIRSGPKRRGSPVPPAPAIAAPGGVAQHRSHPVVEGSRNRIEGETPIQGAMRRWHGGYNDRLILENMCRTDPDGWPSVFRLVTESAQGKALAGTADGVPAKGVFRKDDLRAFYPPLVTGASRQPLPANMQRALSMLRSFMADPRMEVFNVVVDEELHGAPRYYESVQRPSDLATITTRLQNHLYNTVHELKEEIDLVWSNCRRYNPDPHWLFGTSQALEKELNDRWKKDRIATLPSSTSYRDEEPDSPPMSAAQLRKKLVAGAAYSSAYVKTVERLPAEAYTLVAEPVASNPGFVDLHVTLKLDACTDANLRAALGKTSETGRRLKLSRKE